MFKTKEIIKAISSKLHGCSDDLTFSGICQDSRSIESRQIFIAIIGDRFDGHVFLKSVFARGVRAAIVQKGKVDPKEFSDRQLFEVKDTLKALGDLAHWYRTKFNIPIIAITGSNGKTTTKELISEILKTKYEVLKTEGNLNNLMGLPLMLYRLKPQHEVAIFEMGMSLPFEIKRLAQIAKPTAGLITNIGRAHLATMRTMKNIAKAKTELFKALPKGGVAFINGDDPYLARYAKRLKCQVMTYGFSKFVDVKGRVIKDEGVDGVILECAWSKSNSGSFEVHVNLPGEHNAMNALAAIAVGIFYKISSDHIQESLSQFKAEAGRSRLLTLNNGTILIDDCYNANPNSMAEALKMLKKLSNGRRSTAVLGDMLELGPRAKQYHEEVGKIIGEFKIDNVLTYGLLSQYIGRRAAKNKGIKIFSTRKQDDLINKLKQVLRYDSHVVLVKGSHGMKMENVVQALIQEFGVKN